MLTLKLADFPSFAPSIAPEKSSAIATLIAQYSDRVLPPIKIHFPSSARAHKSQILRPLSLAAAPPRRNYHGITSLCMSRRITPIDSNPCKISGGGGGLLFSTVENATGHISKSETCRRIVPGHPRNMGTGCVLERMGAGVFQSAPAMKALYWRNVTDVS